MIKQDRVYKSIRFSGSNHRYQAIGEHISADGKIVNVCDVRRERRGVTEYLAVGAAGFSWVRTGEFREFT